jgi:putative ABC transport system permease protein
MLKNYFLTALRSLRRQKTFSMINAVGMALGMAIFMILTQSAGQKLNADNFHPNASRIYGVIQVQPSDDKAERHTVSAPAPLLAALENEFPEIETGTRAVPGGQRILRWGDRSFYERRILFVDPEFLAMFNFPVFKGGTGGFRSDPRGIVLSQTAAAKYFGDDDPIGKTLTLDNTVDLTVAGVVKDQPRRSSFRFDVLVPFGVLRELGGDLEDWKADLAAVFLLVRKGFDEAAFEAKLGGFADRHFEAAPERVRRLYLLPFLDFRLKSNHIESFLPSSRPVYVVIPFVLGALLLFVVSLNFINLSTARHFYRMKEIGLRKVVGARRGQIIVQLVGESVLLALFALPLAALLFEIVDPAISNYIRTPMAGLEGVPAGGAGSLLSGAYPLKFALLAALLTGVFSGVFPALRLTAFHPVAILRGSARSGSKKRRGSRIMVAFQFTVAVIFIAFAAIMKSQTRNFLRADFGFDREDVATVVVPAELRPKLEALRTEIARDPRVLSVSASAGLPLIWTDNRPARPAGSDPEESVSIGAYEVGNGFIETLGIDIHSGKDFSRDPGLRDGFVINQAAAAKLGLTDPVGRELVVGDRTGLVVGVARDFLFDDIGFAMTPAALMIEETGLNYILVKYAAGTTPALMRTGLERIWRSFAYGLPFEFSTLEERFDRTFDMLGRMAQFLNGLGLAIVLFSGLGLLGLTTFAVERRTREVGIRKVLGASSENITWSLSREFVVPIAVAAAVGLTLITIGWRLVLKTGMLFITGIGLGTYALSLGVCVATAALAVATQTLRAARANPVDSLRVE